MSTATNAILHSSPCTAWAIENFERDGAPPLRVACRCLSRRSVENRAGDHLFLGLWELRNGGYIVSRSVMDGDEPKAAADKAENLETAMRLVEREAAALAAGEWTLEWPQDRAGPSLGAALVHLQTRVERSQSFLKLAGQALDDWQRLIGTEFDSAH